MVSEKQVKDELIACLQTLQTKPLDLSGHLYIGGIDLVAEKVIGKVHHCAKDVCADDFFPNVPGLIQGIGREGLNYILHACDTVFLPPHKPSSLFSYLGLDARVEQLGRWDSGEFNSNTQVGQTIGALIGLGYLAAHDKPRKEFLRMLKNKRNSLDQCLDCLIDTANNRDLIDRDRRLNPYPLFSSGMSEFEKRRSAAEVLRERADSTSLPFGLQFLDLFSRIPRPLVQFALIATVVAVVGMSAAIGIDSYQTQKYHESLTTNWYAIGDDGMKSFEESEWLATVEQGTAAIVSYSEHPDVQLMAHYPPTDSKPPHLGFIDETYFIPPLQVIKGSVLDTGNNLWFFAGDRNGVPVYIPALPFDENYNQAENGPFCVLKMPGAFDEGLVGKYAFVKGPLLRLKKHYDPDAPITENYLSYQLNRRTWAEWADVPEVVIVQERGKFHNGKEWFNGYALRSPDTYAFLGYFLDPYREVSIQPTDAYICHSYESLRPEGERFDRMSIVPVTPDGASVTLPPAPPRSDDGFWGWLF